MKPTPRPAASTLLVLIGALLLHVHPIAALAEPPRVQDPRSRLDDTAAPALFAPGLERALREFNSRRLLGTQAAADAEPARVDLVVHVLAGKEGEGDLSESALNSQLTVLNQAYRSSGLHFNLAEIRRYPDSLYFAGGCFPTTDAGIRMKADLAVDPARFVNIYTCKLQLPFIAGYATFPNQFNEGDPQHGIVVDYGTFPGGAPPLDLGHTLVHEMGHYFGLFHTFQGGCAEPGDGVADTPAEASASFGCQIGRDTCTEPGLDPIDNFMDYSDDRCTNTFTPQQVTRMQASLATFRPRLAAPFAIGPGLTGNWFNPAQDGHGFMVEILPDHRILANWFVYGPSGDPTWIVAVGTYAGTTAVLDGIQKTGPGGRFPPNFDASRLETVRWGSLTFTFTDCNHGQVSWQPALPGYASGSMPISRLTMPAGLNCP